MKERFPALAQPLPNGKTLAFLDGAAGAQKPDCVLESLREHYAHIYANVHRGMYYLSAKTTARYEEARQKIAAFIRAPSWQNVVFTSGATDALNLAAHGFGETIVRAGDEIIVTDLEHHANIVPWQQLCMRKGATLKCARMDEDGNLSVASVKSQLSPRTKIVAFTHMSNALGSVTPAREIIALARDAGAATVLDASQSVVHMKIDVQELDCDVLTFSAHKLYAPNGVGVLYGKKDILESWPPYRTGGEMIDRVDIEEGTTFLPPPMRFEAGTPPFPETIALGAAIDFLCAHDRDAIFAHEAELLEEAAQAIEKLPGFSVVKPRARRRAALPFVHAHAHPSDIGDVLDKTGVAVRSGHHCAQPLLKRLGLSATVRASFCMYNDENDVRALIDGLATVNKIFG
ncbi:MAG: SufS family cysteine desulfurase [Rickettsiales bacterium]